MSGVYRAVTPITTGIASVIIKMASKTRRPVQIRSSNFPTM